MTETQYAILRDKYTGEVIEVKKIFTTKTVTQHHISQGYRIISEEAAERLRPLAKGIEALTV